MPPQQPQRISRQLLVLASWCNSPWSESHAAEAADAAESRTTNMSVTQAKLAMSRSTAVMVTLSIVVVVLMVATGAANTTLPIVLPELNGILGSAVVGTVPGLGSVAYALGKVSATILTHAVGSRVILSVTCALAAVGMQLCSLGTLAWLKAGWVLTSFGVAHVWIACMAVCAAWVDARYRGRTLGIVMGNGSDGGGALASVGFSLLLDWYGGAGWYLVFRVEAMLLLGAALLTLLCLRSTPALLGFAPPSELQADPVADERGGGSGQHQRSPIAPPPHHLASSSLSAALADFLSRGRIWLTLVACR